MRFATGQSTFDDVTLLRVDSINREVCNGTMPVSMTFEHVTLLRVVDTHHELCLQVTGHEH